MKKKILLRSLELIFRFICVLIAINLLSLNSANNNTYIYELTNGIFYFLMLVWIISIIQKLVRTAYIFSEIQVHLKWAKWVMLLETLILLGLKLNLEMNILPHAIKPAVMGKVLMPNLGFVVITLLVFYMSALLEETTKLKQESDLTI